MTDPTTRELIADLLATIKSLAPNGGGLLIARAEAFLAQSEPEGPTAWMYLREPNFDGRDWHDHWEVTLDEKLARYASGNEDPVPLWRTPAINPAPQDSQPEPVPVSADTAFAIGQTGGPPSEVERLAFEAWMRGHSWLVSGKWNGTTYVDPQESHSSIDLPAMQTRMLWAAWRDRAALARWGK